MGLKLLRIELANIRSHEHVIFEPESAGITAIQGVNGVGKSTIVDSVAWSLYGTKPSGVSKANEIFRTGLGDKDPAYARVDLEVDGKPFRFERRRINKHGGIEVEVFSIEKDEKGEEKFVNVAGPAISHAESYIRKHLRMDEKGFLAAVLIQQKQVDQLISAGPRERGQVIEKLTGIAGVTAALTEAKQDFNSLRKAAANSVIDPLELDKLKKDEEKTIVTAKELKEKLQVIKDRVVELKKNGEGVKANLEAATELFDQKAALESEIQALTLRKGIQEAELTTTLEEKDKAKKELIVVGGETVEVLQDLIAEKDTESRRFSLIKSRAEDGAAELSKVAKEKEALLSELESVTGDLPELESFLELKREELRSLQTEIISRQGEKQQLLLAVGIIEHGDSCPTCLQKVSDVSSATKALTDSVARLDKEISSNSKKVLSIEKEGIEAAQLRDKLASKESAEMWLKNFTTDSKEFKKKIDKSASELRVVDKELSIIRKKLEEARHEQIKKQAHQRLLEKAQKLTTELEGIDFQLAKVKKESGALGNSSQRELNSLQKKLDEIRGHHSSFSMEYTAKTGELKLLAQKLEHLRKDISRHEAELEKHNDLVRSVSVAAHTHELIGEFREERIRNSIPVIEVYASDLLSRFTEGQFTRLSLNQKFEATVYLADGTSRAVGLLSGGELSAAAMALRLAISLLLNSGADQNLMILDEVLVSQDANRAEQILITLKEVAHGQVILIAHNESIDSVADKIVTLRGKQADAEEGVE